MQLSKLPLMVTWIILSCLLLAGCQSGTAVTQNTPSIPQQTPLATDTAAAPLPTPTETEVPERTLVVCTQEEPQTLYLYGGSSRAMWSVLESVYDGPFDTRAFSVQPVILTKTPSLQDGDTQIQPVSVQAGDTVVDVNGNLVALAAGVNVLPSGCSQPDCAVTWDGTSTLSMDQLVVTFRLLDNLKWSDGAPLTAADSVYSYQLSADPATPASRYLTDRTFSYTDQDETTVEWTGLPGFYEQRFATFFWLPLPKHAWGTLNAQSLLTDARSTRAPMGWGPYVIAEWVSGDHITLRKNENYHRAAEGLPRFDTLVYRFIGETADANLNALLTGECDVVDQNEQMLSMLPGLLERESAQRLKTYYGQGPEWEHISFGIRPASYDDGYNAATDRADLFGDTRTRQAFAYCIDREAIIAEHIYRRSQVPVSYLPPSHPLYSEDLPRYPYNPTEGMRLLDEVGWKDTDNDPGTPRISVGVTGVPDGTELRVNYYTSQAQLREQVARSVAANLSQCGIHSSLNLTPQGELFSPGPDGPVFGRQFDLVQFSWEASSRPNCLPYATSQIPTSSNLWIGANITGLNNPEYDAACASAYWARPNEPDYQQRILRAQEQFLSDLPAIPLYFYPKIAISRPDLCGLEVDVTARSIYWNIEVLDLSIDCK